MKNFQKITACFFVGVLSTQWLEVLPPIGLLVFLVLLSIAIFKWANWLSVICLGFVWAASYAVVIDSARLPSSLEGKEILLQGEVVGLPVIEPKATKFLFKVNSDAASIRGVPFPSNIRLSRYGKGQEIRSGEHWQFLVKLKRPHGLANPYGFDYEKWLFQNQIGATGYVRKSIENKRISPASRWGMSYWRESLKDYLDASLQGSVQLGVIKALVLGDRSEITGKQWEVFRKTGSSHLIAISGLHIGLVSALIFWFVRWVCLRIKMLNRVATQSAVVVSLLVAIGYAGLAGFSIPTQRALIMLSVVLGAVYLRRHYTPLHVLSVALLAVIIHNPLSVMSAGFWLSFGAVAVILYGMTGRVKPVSMMSQLIRTQWVVAIGLMPLVLYFFQQLSIVAPLANALAVPWVSFLVAPLLLFALPVGLLSSFVSTQGLLLVDKLIDYLWLFLSALAEFEFSSLSISSASIWAYIIAMIGVILMLLPKGLIPKPSACLLFVPLFFPVKNNPLPNGDFTVMLLDVGQGLSVSIHTATHTMIFDTGAKYSDKSDLASTVIIPYLHGLQTNNLDLLVVSHGDNDHAGGAKTLLTTLKVNRLLTSVPELFDGFNAESCVEGMSWQWDGVDFEFLNPSKFSLFEGNDASCVLKVSSLSGSILLTGDIEKNTERSLLQYLPEKLQADVLIAPHHGSKTSSTERFIDEVAPGYVLFPVGYRNRFGFPKPTIVDRYKERGIKQFDTANDGALSIKFASNEPIKIEGFRENNTKFWSWKP